MNQPTVHHGDCIAIMAGMPEASVDAIVCDPPYDLTAGKKGGTGTASLNLNSPAGRSRISTGGGFMGKQWDATGVAFDPETWRAALRVLKPGGHMLAFGGTRTWHRLAVAVEDAGFEIRDSIAWLYGEGFPKGRRVLKPAFEPVLVARRPFRGSEQANVEAHGTGGLFVAACRIGARWAANVALDDNQATRLDEAVGPLAKAGNKAPIRRFTSGGYEGGWGTGTFGLHPAMEDGDNTNASRFFYVAKAPKGERPVVDGVAHPTVKPLTLMRWLVRLVTPPGGTVLDPFAGSGTTVEAAILEGFRVIGIEQEQTYLPLIQERIRRSQRGTVEADDEPTLFGESA